MHMFTIIRFFNSIKISYLISFLQPNRVWDTKNLSALLPKGLTLYAQLTAVYVGERTVQ